MSHWIKICGNTSFEDAQMAVEAGADAVGFIFATSPRKVTSEKVARITPLLPAAIEKIGVFVDSSFEEISACVQQAELTGVQLHFKSEDSLAARLRRRFGNGLRILQVIHFGADASVQLGNAALDASIDGVLVDSRTATAVGGTGIAFDWNVAKAELFRNDSQIKLIAAGGLNPENVAAAINILKPWGVDVVSGVEAEPGKKDPGKLHDFVGRARTAFGSENR